MGGTCARDSLGDEDGVLGCGGGGGRVVVAAPGRTGVARRRRRRRRRRRGRLQPGSVVDRRRLRRVALPDEVLEDLHRQRKDDGRVLLGRDGVERLEVAQLERRRRLADDVRRLLQRPGRLLLTLRRYHLPTAVRRVVKSYILSLVCGHRTGLHVVRQHGVLREVGIR